MGAGAPGPRRVHPAEAALRAVRGVRGAPAAIQLPGLISSLGVRLGAGSQRAAVAPRSRPLGPSRGWRRIAAAGKGGQGRPSRRDHSLGCSVPRGGRGAMRGADAVVPTLPFGPCRVLERRRGIADRTGSRWNLGVLRTSAPLSPDPPDPPHH